jgi:mono/diheme cytochrome c family protein
MDNVRERLMRFCILLLTFAVCCLSALPAAPRAKVDFIRDVQPIFAQRCLTCHSEKQQMGGLRLDRKADALKGGKGGKVIIAGNSADSRLIRLVSGAEKIVMPPAGEKLSAAQVATLKAWIDEGAQWSDNLEVTKGGGHWAFIALQRPKVPAVKNKWWVKNPIDNFILSRFEKEGIKPSPYADRVTLIRRLYLDLLGLLPTPAEVHAFLNDTRPDAYEKLVDRLLASPHFGERWGRHWLDLARYADSDGYEKDLPRPYAYLWRNWVIDALNKDMPFDQFTIAQIGGDQLPNATLEQKTATGFHRNTLTNREGGVDQEEYRIRAVKDRVETTGTVWLGLTVACANCHDHKYDPISQKEFYGLFAFFNTAMEVDVPVVPPNEWAAYEKAKKSFDDELSQRKAALANYEKEQLPARLAAWEKSVKLPDANLPAAIAEILAIPASRRSDAQKAELTKHYRLLDAEWVKRNEAVTEHAKTAPAEPTKAMTIAANPNPPKSHIHIRGDFLQTGDEAQPGTLNVLQPFEPQSDKPTRLDLARWLVDPNNPLTARVAVNRIWQHLFGRGIVPTPNDFGTRGEKPSHPELLDWLATTFMSTGQLVNKSKSKPVDQLTDLPIDSYGCGWSQKAMIKLIVMSATYQQSSRSRPDLTERDPKNVLLARQNRFRPEAEIVRDLYLSASGLLNPTIGGPSIRPPLPADIAALGYANSVKWSETQGTDKYKRGLYIFFQRTVPYPMLSTFDAPDSNVTCTRRERSNTPLQALTLLNDPVFFECAQALGRRVVVEKPNFVRDRVRHLFRLCLSREPNPNELSRLRRLYDEILPLCQSNTEAAAKLVGDKKTEGFASAEAAAWVTLARTVLNLDEFVTRE